MSLRPAERIAKRFHEEYERLAPAYNWTTQPASRVHWNDLPDNQRRLMVHTVANLLAESIITTPGQPVERRPKRRTKRLRKRLG